MVFPGLSEIDHLILLMIGKCPDYQGGEDNAWLKKYIP
jgi:hypothetical protein